MGQQAPCSYCPYRPVCRFDVAVAGNTYDAAGREDTDEMIQKMFDEGDDEHGLDE
jgi:ATP-dependent helicase/nuclease subunit B